MILIDSSVWIDYFKGGVESALLSDLIINNLVLTNEIILTEIIPLLKKRNQHGLVHTLLSFEKLDLDVFWEGIRKIQLLNLNSGVNKVGLPDLLIAQQCVDKNVELWSFDKHFKMMSEYLELKLFN
ncbi:MAG: putative nucleic acid-binding protein [Arcticibacterium sp.]|jgi:predicted nucleic acid-binding protein